MPGKTIYLTRHCQALHNVDEDYMLPDCVLTAKGRDQAKKLNEETKDTLQKEVDLIVSSPLKRTIQTTLDGYPGAIQRLGGKKNILLLPEAQECNDFPCDTGSARAELEKIDEFKDLDFSRLTDDWTSKAGKWAPTPSALSERARFVREFLRSRPEKTIVLVAHGDILRYIVYGEHSSKPWANAEVRKYEFVRPDGQDEGAWLKEIEVEAKEGKEEPTSSEGKL